jgi:phosphate transport system substrate-binding protein
MSTQSWSKVQVTITGSSTIAPLMSEIAKSYEASHSEVRIDVQSGGSSRGISDARKGLAQIGMVSRNLKPDEKDLTSYAIAKDGVCVILNKINKVKSLTDDQIVKIYKGEIKNWKDVGGADQEITVVNKAEGRSTLELFLNYFNIKNADIKASVIIGDNEQGIKTVAGNPNAIGYVSVGSAEYSAQNKVAIKLLPMNYVEATIKNVELGKFPMSRTLNLVTFGQITPEVKNMLEYFTSPKVASLIKEQYFVPIKK